MEQPSWLVAAWAELGVAEAAGSSDNARVVSYYREAGHGEISHDEVPWCAAFAGAMLKRGGIEGSGSLMARSYIGWGEPLAEARLGAVTVLERGSDPAAGHVGFFIGNTKGKVVLLGGNQSDRVCVEAFEADRVLAYRWPLSPNLGSSQPVVHEPDTFTRALAHVLELEGGFSDDPYDPGGPTNRGITLAVFARFKGETVNASNRARLIDDLKRIPGDVVETIYRSRYWQPAQCAAMPAAVALFHFDAAVNHGVRGAARMLQQALGVEADGEIGPLTLTALARCDVATVLAGYAAIRRDRYRSLPHFWRFGRGWLKRVSVSEASAKALIAEHPIQLETAKGGSAMEHTSDTQPTAKWWAQSKTIWGAVITAAATVLPALGPLVGLELSADVVKEAGEQTLAAAQAIVGLFGTLLTLYGRLKADGPLTRRSVNVRL